MQPSATVRVSLAVLASLLLPISTALAAVTPSFSDVPEEHPAFNAVEHLKEKGIFTGYTDGTFKPEKIVNRAEAVKIIVGSTVSDSVVLGMKAKTVFDDIPADAWYMASVEYARQKLGIIDGPPKKMEFHAAAPVKEAEFLKMLLLARKVDAAAAFSDLKGALAPDAANAKSWDYVFLRYALASSMIGADAGGNLLPAKELTREDVAQLLFRYDMYTQNRRTQALLTESEQEIVNVLTLLEGKDASRALMASNRALVAARGALAGKPEDPQVKGTVKAAEAFQTLVRAYQAGSANKLNDVLQLTSDAWHLAEKAKGFAVNLQPLMTQLQGVASNMAKEARGLMKK